MTVKDLSTSPLAHVTYGVQKVVVGDAKMLLADATRLSPPKLWAEISQQVSRLQQRNPQDPETAADMLMFQTSMLIFLNLASKKLALYVRRQFDLMYAGGHDNTETAAAAPAKEEQHEGD